MIRIIAVFFACLMAVNAQDSGLQLTIGTEQVSLGIDGVPRKLPVIAVTIANPGDSPRSLIVGRDYGNADHWDVTVNVMNRDGTIVELTHLPRMIVIAGYFGPLVIEIPAHGTYRTLLDARDFEEVVGRGSTNLSGFISAPGLQFQIIVHCGHGEFPGASLPIGTWKGDLVSAWLKSENPDPNR